MESSEEKDVKVNGFEEIYKFLVHNKLINDVKSYSVTEEIGLKLAKQFEAEFELELLSLSNKFWFYLRTTSFPECRHFSNPFQHGFSYRSRLLYLV